MKKSREFNDILDECLERLLVKGETIEQCLQSFPEYVGELKPLLEAAVVTRQISAVQPRLEFRDKARYELYSAFREIEQKKSRSFFSWGLQPRWVTVVAILVILFLAGGVTVAAARGSMPDNFLYPVKLATEQVRLVFTFSSLGKAEFYASLADKRVAEIIYLAENNETGKIEQVANSLNDDLTEIAMLSESQGVMTAMKAVPAAEDRVLLEEAAVAGEVTESEEEVMPEEEKAIEEEVSVTVPAPEEAGNGETLMTEQVSSDTGADTATDRRIKLRDIIASQAINNVASLRALLEKVPESVKPALLNAITLLENGYENALRALD